VIKVAVPVLHVAGAEARKEFYCNKLGFRLEFAHRGDSALAGPCYMGMYLDGVWIHLSSFSRDGVAGGVVTFLVDSVDTLHAEFVSQGVAIHVEPIDQSWSMREMYVKDADRNCLRFQV
jgi:catechol 2,3-dioxygenase-like lactoylglutathione lyase family enzyme